MSELKVYHHELRHNEYEEFYLKYEADKVIAGLNAQVDFLKTTHDSCGNCNSCADGMGKVLNEQLDELKKKLIEQTALRMWAETQLHHNKYKRCLAMAERCKYRMYYLAAVVEQEASKIIPLKAQIQRYEKRERRMDYWKNRWLELAEKFKDKEAK